MCGRKYDPDCDPPVVEWLLKPFPSVLVLNEGERGSHPELSTMNGALELWMDLSAGSAGRREWLERRLG